jgi:hypothetical protein
MLVRDGFLDVTVNVGHPAVARGGRYSFFKGDRFHILILQCWKSFRLEENRDGKYKTKGAAPFPMDTPFFCRTLC